LPSQLSMFADESARPEGLHYRRDFISAQEEAALIAQAMEIRIAATTRKMTAGAMVQVSVFRRGLAPPSPPRARVADRFGDRISIDQWIDVPSHRTDGQHRRSKIPPHRGNLSSFLIARSSSSRPAGRKGASQSSRNELT
jgi:hypothetical protein